MRKLVIGCLFIIGALLLARIALAASATFEVDPVGQEYDAIELFFANKPRVIDVTKPPAYSGTANRFTILNLVNGQTYEFASRLRKGDIVSELSNIITHKMSDAPVYSAPDLKFLGYDRESGGLLFSVDDLGQQYESIRLYGAATGAQINLNGTHLYAGTEKSFSVTGLPPGEQWQFTAVLVSGDQHLAQSAVVLADIPMIIQLHPPKLIIIKVE